MDLGVATAVPAFHRAAPCLRFRESADGRLLVHGSQFTVEVPGRPMFMWQSRQMSKRRFPWESGVTVADISGFASMASKKSRAFSRGTFDTTYFSPFGMLAPHTSQER